MKKDEDRAEYQAAITRKQDLNWPGPTWEQTTGYSGINNHREARRNHWKGYI